MADIFEIRGIAKSLNLGNIAKGKVDLSVGTPSQLTFLKLILQQEYSIRVDDRRKRLLHESHIPQNKHFEEGLVSSAVADQAEYLFEFDFSSKTKNILIYGTSCTGKTGLACDIGRSAIKKDARVFYTTFEDFINPKMFKTLASKDVVIVDDVFYIKPNEEELILFYKRVRALEETTSLIIVSNRSLADWIYSIDYDKHMLEALVTGFNYNAQIIRLAPNC